MVFLSSEPLNTGQIKAKAPPSDKLLKIIFEYIKKASLFP